MIFTEVLSLCSIVISQHNLLMQGNFIMLQKDDLKQVVSELVEELIGKKFQTDLTPGKATRL